MTEEIWTPLRYMKTVFSYLVSNFGRVARLDKKDNTISILRMVEKEGP